MRQVTFTLGVHVGRSSVHHVQVGRIPRKGFLWAESSPSCISDHKTRFACSITHRPASWRSFTSTTKQRSKTNDPISSDHIKSSVGGESATAGSTLGKGDRVTKAVHKRHSSVEQPSRPLFPWRHEPGQRASGDTDMNDEDTDDGEIGPLLPPRLVPGTREHDAIRGEIANDIVAWFHLKHISLWNVLVTKSWKQEMADAMMWAFRQGVAGIISNTYKIPLNDLVSSKTTDEGDEKLTFNFPPSEGGISHDSDNKQKDKFCPNVADLLARPLRSRFEAAHASGRNQLRVRLEVRPKEALFYRIYGMPFVTRDYLEQHPNFLEEFLKQVAISPAASWQYLQQNLLDSVSEQQELKGEVSTTLAAEIFVVCDEIFSVHDATTGALLQGSEGDDQPREVVHLVTFEMTTGSIWEENFPYRIFANPGNWQIADVDDLMGSKKWFHV